MIYDVTPIYLQKPKPKYRIQWDYLNGKVIGYWVWGCNVQAIELYPSKYFKL